MAIASRSLRRGRGASRHSRGVTAIAVGLSVVLLAGVGLGTIAITTPSKGIGSNGDRETSEQASMVASLQPTTASTALNGAIAALMSAETFRFELVMRRTKQPSEGAWRVSGSADMSNGARDPARVQATVAVGAGGSYTVLSDQIRIGDQVYTRSPGAQVYTDGASGGPGLTDTGPVDPVSSILGSASDLPASAFRTTNDGGDRVVHVDASGLAGVSKASRMTVRVDQATGLIQKIRMVGRRVTSSLVLTDVGDPDISISAPAR